MRSSLRDRYRHLLVLLAAATLLSWRPEPPTPLSGGHVSILAVGAIHQPALGADSAPDGFSGATPGHGRAALRLSAPRPCVCPAADGRASLGFAYLLRNARTGFLSVRSSTAPPLA